MILHPRIRNGYCMGILLYFASSACSQTCSKISLDGLVKDGDGYRVSGAMIVLDSMPSRTSGPDGSFSFSCLTAGTHNLSVSAPGFKPIDQVINVPLQRGRLEIKLVPFVITNVQVSGDDDSLQKATVVGPAQVFEGERLRELADDPDDLQRELQQLAGAVGGNPTDTVITVDGFQDSTKIPPRSSIAYIKVNSDLYSAEYRQPPSGGGRVEIYTKPGQSHLHGDLFAVTSGAWLNARNPFSTGAASLGKERFGFNLSGPVTRENRIFALSLEHRSTADTASINAFTLDGSGTEVHTLATVPIPQTRWIGSARLDWQLGTKNTFMLSYGAWRNDMDNVGVGGTNLQESGYTSNQYDDVLRMLDVTTISSHLMHAVHASLRFTGESDIPNSTLPQVIVSGAFSGGGSTIGPQHLHERFLELDDDVTLVARAHSIKAGTQTFVLVESPSLTTGFNGSYLFGGGPGPVLDSSNAPIPGQTEILTGLEQYRRTLFNLPGGIPTTFSNVAGTPKVAYSQISSAFFGQDEWNIAKNAHISTGIRYYIQDNPLLANGLTPRIGMSWAVGKKRMASFHAHYGLFTGRINSDDANELHRMDGIQRITSTIYSPIFGDPFSGATPIHSFRSVNPAFCNFIQGSANVGVNVDLARSGKSLAILTLVTYGKRHVH